MRVSDINNLPDGRLKDQLMKKSNPSERKSNKRLDLEHELQKRAKEYMMLQYPQFKKRFFAIPNGGARDATTGGKLKAEGVLAGVWDLFLSVPRGDCGGCWIETKWGKNKLTDTQKAFRKANRDDYHFFVYRSIDEFIDRIENYLNQ